MKGNTPVRAAWLFVVIMFALGTAGLVTAMAHLPGTDSRSELTWRADQAIKPALDFATGELDRIATDFEALGGQGRLAVAALAQGDAKQLEEAMTAGQALVDKIVLSVAGVRSGLRTLPGFGPIQQRFFSAPTIERWNSINAALDTTDGLGAIWLSLTTGGTDAVRLMSLLEQHDEFVGLAAKLGSEGNFTEAVHQLDLAAPVFQELRTLQVQLSNRVDVALLEELLDRTARVDDALRALYTLLVLTNGESTAEVKAALAAVDAARDELPEDTRALSVILTDIGRTGPNEAVIRIEGARGRLLDAIGALSEVEASPEPGDDGEGDGDDVEPTVEGESPAAT
jgi:hypothetical protein